MFNRKVMAFLQLPSSKEDIYKPQNKALVHNIFFHNINTSSEFVELFYNDGINEFQILRRPLVSDETFIWEFIGEGMIIEPPGRITGFSTTASMVTCYISGTEE